MSQELSQCPIAGDAMVSLLANYGLFTLAYISQTWSCGALVKSGSADVAPGLWLGLALGLGQGMNYSATRCDIRRSAFYVAGALG